MRRQKLQLLALVVVVLLMALPAVAAPTALGPIDPGPDPDASKASGTTDVTAVPAFGDGPTPFRPAGGHLVDFGDGPTPIVSLQQALSTWLVGAVWFHHSGDAVGGRECFDSGGSLSGFPHAQALLPYLGLVSGQLMKDLESVRQGVLVTWQHTPGHTNWTDAELTEVFRQAVLSCGGDCISASTKSALAGRVLAAGFLTGAGFEDPPMSLLPEGCTDLPCCGPNVPGCPCATSRCDCSTVPGTFSCKQGAGRVEDPCIPTPHACTEQNLGVRQDAAINLEF